jgi:aspartate racemase
MARVATPSRRFSSIFFKKCGAKPCGRDRIKRFPLCPSALCCCTHHDARRIDRGKTITAECFVGPTGARISTNGYSTPYAPGPDGIRRLGVLGGMGPAATADFLAKLVRATPATRDWDHIPVVLRSFPQIPDRSDAILHGGRSPLPDMIEGVHWLSQSNVDAIAIACNTAHHWYDELQKAVDVPILHIADAVARALLHRSSPSIPAALFATEGTIRSGVIEQRLAKNGLSILSADPFDVEQIMRAIREAKAGRFESGDRFFREATARVVSRGARQIVLACTELPLLPSAADRNLYLDATDALAHFCVTCLQAPPAARE